LCSCFVPTPAHESPAHLSTTQPSRLTPEAAARRARDIDRLERLAEIGMQLAERAGARALAENNEPEPAKQPEPKPARIDPNLLFKSLARTVKDIIAIKSRLDAGLVPDAPAHETEASDEWHTLTDPRRKHIIRAMDEAIKTSPLPKSEHAALRKTVGHRTLEFLAADPDQTLPAAVAIVSLCNEFKLPFDIRQFDDELIVPPGHKIPNGQQEPGDDLSFISGVHHPP